jgi:uncharacterized protein (DUF952 family)
MRPTFHLVPTEAWTRAEPLLAQEIAYAPASFDDEGFIHCTDGLAALGQTFDRFYATDPRAFVALTLDLDALDVPWRFDEPGRPFPHIYGRIGPAAVTLVQRVERTGDGRFAALAPR